MVENVREHGEAVERETLLKSSNMEPPEGWRERRKRTMAIFLLVTFGNGFTFTTIFTTLWSYVNKCLHLSDPNLTYGLIASGRFVGPLLLAVLVSRWLDRSRSVKLFMVVVTLVQIAGCAIYTINTSPYIPVLGAVMIGVGILLKIAKNSELIRMYSKDEVQQMFLYSMILYGLGEATGPIAVKLLDDVHFEIGGLEICYGNIAGPILLVFNIIQLLSIIPFSYDLSKEFDLKAQEGGTPEANSVSTWSSLQQSLSPDAVLLFFQQFFTGFYISFLCRTFPLVVDALNYSDFILDVCFFVASISMMIISIVATRTILSQQGVYMCGISCLVGILISHVALRLVPLGFSMYLNGVLLSTLVVAYGFCYVTDQTFIVVTLGKMFPSSVQSSVEGIRVMIHWSGSLLASFFSAYMYKEFSYVMLVLIPIVMILLIVMVLRRKILIRL